MHNENTHIFLQDGSVALKLVVLNCSVHPKRGPSAINSGFKWLNFVIGLQYNDSINCCLLMNNLPQIWHGG